MFSTPLSLAMSGFAFNASDGFPVFGSGSAEVFRALESKGRCSVRRGAVSERIPRQINLASWSERSSRSSASPSILSGSDHPIRKAFGMPKNTPGATTTS